MPSLLILIPLFGIIILNAFSKKMSEAAAFWFAFAVFLAQILLSIFHHPVFWAGHLDSLTSFFNVSFSIDSLSFIMLLCIGIVSLASLLVARYTLFNEKEKFKFINLLIIVSIGMSGIVLAKDLFTMYVFLEVTAIASFVLIAFNKDAHALEGAFKYMILSSVATILMLLGIALFLLFSNSTSFEDLRSALSQYGTNPLAAFALGLFICGVFIKGGLVPFHGWLPDAYSSAPAAVSVLLAGVVTKAAGIYTIMRVVASVCGFTDPIKSLLMLVGAISIVVGAFAALGQNDFKRMLAYSSISQVGYIVLGFGVGTELGVMGAVFHLFNHSIFKSLLFVNSASVESEIGTTDMNKMGGVASKMPVTGATSVIGFLSASGMPPLSGFWSKLIIIMALWQNGNYIYAAIAIFSSILTLAYLLIMQRKVFFGKLLHGLEGIKEARLGMVATSGILAVILIAFGLFFPFVFNALMVPLKGILIR